MRARIAVVVLAVALAAVAGCIGTDSPEASDVQAAGAQAGAGAGSIYEVLVPDEAPTNASFTATFAPHEACVPVGCTASDATGESYEVRTFDVTDMLPVGVYTHLEVDVTREDHGAVPLGTSDTVYVRTATETYGETSSTPSDTRDRYSFDLVRRTDEPAHLVLEYLLPEADDSDYTYELDVSAERNETVLDDGVPARLSLAGGQEVSIEGVHEPPVAAQLYGPEGELVRQAATDEGPLDVAVPADAPAGSYTLVPVGVGQPYRVAAVDGEAGLLEPLPAELHEGEPRELEDGRAAWSFETSDPLVQAGIRLTTGEASWAEGLPAQVQGEKMRVELTGPAGAVLAEDADPAFNCVACPEPRSYTYASVGTPDAPAGTYEALVENAPGPGGTVQEIAVSFDPGAG